MCFRCQPCARSLLQLQHYKPRHRIVAHAGSPAAATPTLIPTCGAAFPAPAAVASTSVTQGERQTRRDAINSGALRAVHARTPRLARPTLRYTPVPATAARAAPPQGPPVRSAPPRRSRRRRKRQLPPQLRPRLPEQLLPRDRQIRHRTYPSAACHRSAAAVRLPAPRPQSTAALCASISADDSQSASRASSAASAASKALAADFRRQPGPDRRDFIRLVRCPPVARGDRLPPRSPSPPPRTLARLLALPLSVARHSASASANLGDRGSPSVAQPGRRRSPPQGRNPPRHPRSPRALPCLPGRHPRPPWPLP